ncbi:MAG: sigma-70 family RNA polymerase sigma factor [Planctomycetes bacterium]|nr:sigma-70 family RNA polymerase sigma factor [Planctomycetota bacterium]
MRDGDPAAAADLLPLVYEQLRAIAGQMMRGGRPGHTLQPTALVHEAWLKIDRAVGGGSHLRDREHFLAVAATAMRQVLVNHARERRAQKRGGDAVRVPLDDHLDVVESKAGSVVELDDVLQRFAQSHARAAQVVELRVFGGLSIEAAARTLGVAESTISEDWRFARVWLARELPGGGKGPA